MKKTILAALFLTAVFMAGCSSQATMERPEPDGKKVITSPSSGDSRYSYISNKDVEEKNGCSGTDACMLERDNSNPENTSKMKYPDKEFP